MAQIDSAADTATDAEAAKPPHPMAEYIELAKTVGYALLIALVLRIVLFQPFTIPSASMEPGLKEGDYIIVSKFAYGWSRHSILFSPPIFSGRLFGHEPKRGDIIVFKLPRDGHTDYIKRLIGLPGDRLQIKHGVVLVNGVAMQERQLSPELSETAFRPEDPSAPPQPPRLLDRFEETTGKKRFITYSAGRDTAAENTGVFTVPQGCYFMMGDNRDNSLDSRFFSDAPNNACTSSEVQPFLTDQAGVGFVPAENLVGRAEITLFSWRRGASLFKPWTWVLNADFRRFFHPLS